MHPTSGKRTKLCPKPRKSNHRLKLIHCFEVLMSYFVFLTMRKTGAKQILNIALCQNQNYIVPSYLYAVHT